jgi:hypothetical protein
VLLALVPLFKLFTGKLPVTPPLLLDARLIGGKSAPTNARSDGTPLLPLGVATTRFPEPEGYGGAHVPLPVHTVVELALVPPFKLVTGKLPVTPPLLLDARFIGGKSAPTMARADIAPLAPFGEARNSLAAIPVHHEKASVPLPVMGLPVTHKGLTAVAETLLTVPPPVPGGTAQIPSPRQNVVLLALVPPLRLAGGRLPNTYGEPAPRLMSWTFHVPESAPPGWKML